MDGGCPLQNDIKNNKMKIIVGQVDFINCLPINLPIELGEVALNENIISAIPSELNKMILNKEIDIAPVSSYAYLENKDKLSPLDNLCIASDGPADSVLLFSHFPLEELDGAKVALSKASATSNKLLEVIFKEFIKINVKYEVPNDSSLSSLSSKYPSALFIGDQALLEYSKMPRNVFIYDLGSLWKKYTGLPMVFGLWVVRKEIEEKHPEKVKQISEILNKAKEIGLGVSFEKVLKKAQEKLLIPKDFYSNYFKHLNYDFNADCKKGLSLFEDYCKKSSLSIV